MHCLLLAAQLPRNFRAASAQLPRNLRANFAKCYKTIVKPTNLINFIEKRGPESRFHKINQKFPMKFLTHFGLFNLFYKLKIF